MTQSINIVLLFFFVSCGQHKQDSSYVETVPKTSNNTNFDTAKTFQKSGSTNSSSNLKFVIDSTNEYSKILTVYRDKQKLLTHTIYKNDGDCSSVSIELGNYKISGNEVIFYSYWASADRQGLILMPFGFRKQIFRLDDNNKLQIKENKIYIEDYIDKTVGKENFYENQNTTRHIGRIYLNELPKTNYQLIARNDYIKSIEKIYKAKFVLENERELLEDEVRNVLKAEIALNTDSWSDKEIWGVSKR
jgi:hypothetical protein